jgi:hypothetical protein
MAGTMAAGQTPYPVQFAVDYPGRPLNRLTSFFRIFVIIPISILLGTVSGGTWEWTGGHSSMAYGGRLGPVRAGPRPSCTCRPGRRQDAHA